VKLVYLTELLFELSNDDRLSILLELEKGPKNLTIIAKKLGFTAQSTSRNVARLMQTSLISRNSNGEYILTPYGGVSLNLLNSYRFLSANRVYFMNHDASILPYHFIGRLGELTMCSFQGDFITTFAYAERMMREEIGVGMIQNPHYNKGKPWFIHFRPLLHSPHKLFEDQLETYKRLGMDLWAIKDKVKAMKKKGTDTSDIDLELKLAEDKLKSGSFRMVEIYIESLKSRVGIHDKKKK